jgi:hypothetical protein
MCYTLKVVPGSGYKAIRSWVTMKVLINYNIENLSWYVCQSRALQVLRLWAPIWFLYGLSLAGLGFPPWASCR